MYIPDRQLDQRVAEFPDMNQGSAVAQLHRKPVPIGKWYQGGQSGLQLDSHRKADYEDCPVRACFLA